MNDDDVKIAWEMHPGLRFGAAMLCGMAIAGAALALMVNVPLYVFHVLIWASRSLAAGAYVLAMLTFGLSWAALSRRFDATWTAGGITSDAAICVIIAAWFVIPLFFALIPGFH